MEPLALNIFQSSRSAEYGPTQMSAYINACITVITFKRLFEIHIPKIGNSIMC